MKKEFLEKATPFLSKVKEISVKTFGFIFAFVKKHKIISAIIVILLVAAIVLLCIFGGKKNEMEEVQTETEVTRMTIKQSISGSSNVEANDTYTVTPLVTGEILESAFEEGDIVE